VPGTFTALLGTPGCPPRVAAATRDRAHGRTVVVDTQARQWPFARTTTPSAIPASPALVVIERLDEAFPDGQGGGVRLVLTQATYQLQRWLDWLALHPAVSVLADGSSAPPALLHEARTRRGPWSRIELVDVAPEPAGADPPSPLLAAFRQPSPAERHEVCAQAVAASRQPDPAILLALASACLEVGRLEDAFVSLESARRAAPDWEAVLFELGKACLRADDTARAAGAFAEAARLMPSFAAAHANLGAALGELERPGEALLALDAAVALDAEGHPAHNSRGACLRDLGRLPEAEASFRRVIALRPAFPFGHYNLGQVLFLQGRFADARRAYEEGLRTDPARTPWQLARLALACAAVDDRAAATSHAHEALDAVQPERRPELAAEMREVLDALAAVQGASSAAIQSVAALVTDRAGTS
jgi:tetratricopeptide (TPR) repeat protein